MIQVVRLLRTTASIPGPGHNLLIAYKHVDRLSEMKKAQGIVSGREQKERQTPSKQYGPAKIRANERNSNLSSGVWHKPE